jgi:hypothetical protein
MEELINLLCQTLEQMPKDLINLIINFLKKPKYYIKDFLVSCWPDIMDVKIHNNHLYAAAYSKKYRKISCWNIGKNGTHKCEDPYYENYKDISIRMIEWFGNRRFICDNNYNILTRGNFSFFQHIHYFNFGEIKKFMIINDFFVILNKRKY